jgi:hypothetical protein
VRSEAAKDFSLSSVSRWRSIFLKKQTQLRSELLQITDPPDQVTESAMELTLKHLRQCFNTINPIANYQVHFQKGWS